METATSTLAILPNTKEQIELFANKLISEIENGQVNPLELIIIQKSFEKMFDKVKETLTKAMVDEAEKYGKKFEFKGAKIELVEAGVKYDYSSCGDTQYTRVNEQILQLSEVKKQREAFIKSLKEPMQVLDEETSELVTVYPPKKSSTTTLKVTI